MKPTRTKPAKSKLEYALRLAELGFYVFPLEPGSKLPHIDEWQKKASRVAEKIIRWWTDPVMGLVQDYNIGISTSHYKKDKALFVVDVDNKGSKRGDDELAKLKTQGLDLPETMEAVTPTGGKHLLYFVDKAVRQGANVLAPGLDIRSRGGYIVGIGSTLPSGKYTLHSNRRKLVRAPAWCVARCGVARDRRPEPGVVRPGIDENRARARAIAFLKDRADTAVQESGGDSATYTVAARLKDFGVSRVDAWGLMLDHWNPRCQPPWTPDELKVKVDNAYRYGHDAQGSDAPEVQFSKIDNAESKADKGSPIDRLNKDFAFVIAGGGCHILWETLDTKGNFKLEHLNLGAFHNKHASWVMQVGNRTRPVTELWMESRQRRSYDGICFLPGKEKEVLVQ